MSKFQFELWHLAVLILVIILLINQIGGVSVLLSLLGLSSPSFQWYYECVEMERKEGDSRCVLDSPNIVNSGPFNFVSSEPVFAGSCKSKYPDSTTEMYVPKSVDKDGNIVEGDPVSVTNAEHWTTENSDPSCWSVAVTYNGVSKSLHEGEEWEIVPDYIKIKVDNIFAGVRDGKPWDNFRVDYSFYVDMTGISAEFEDSSPLVAFRQEHKETVLVTNKITDLDGGFLITKESKLLFEELEGWQEHSKDGIPKGLSEAPLSFMVWELGDNQYRTIPYVNFSSSKTYTEPDCDEDCPVLTMTTLKKSLMSPNIAEKTTRTLVGKEEPTTLIIIQRNVWMQQFPELFYEATPIKVLSIAEPEQPSEEMSVGAGIILVVLLVATIGLAIYGGIRFFRGRKK